MSEMQQHLPLPLLGGRDEFSFSLLVSGHSVWLGLCLLFGFNQLDLLLHPALQ